MLYRSAYTAEAVYAGMSMAPSIWIINFALIYRLNPSLGFSEDAARWMPIPAKVSLAIAGEPQRAGSVQQVRVAVSRLITGARLDRPWLQFLRTFGRRLSQRPELTSDTRTPPSAAPFSPGRKSSPTRRLWVLVVRCAA
jgi:hypothetical protein